jgi:hypothetical protein
MKRGEGKIPFRDMFKASRAMILKPAMAAAKQGGGGDGFFGAPLPGPQNTAALEALRKVEKKSGVNVNTPISSDKKDGFNFDFSNKRNTASQGGSVINVGDQPNLNYKDVDIHQKDVPLWDIISDRYHKTGAELLVK